MSVGRAATFLFVAVGAAMLLYVVAHTVVHGGLSR